MEDNEYMRFCQGIGDVKGYLRQKAARHEYYRIMGEADARRRSHHHNNARALAAEARASLPARHVARGRRT